MGDSLPRRGYQELVGRKEGLISPQWIGNVSWNDSTVTLNLSRESIRRSPEYTDETQLSRDYETELYRHYGQQGYWAGELNATVEFKGLAGRETRKKEGRPALKRTS